MVDAMTECVHRPPAATTGGARSGMAQAGARNARRGPRSSSLCTRKPLSLEELYLSGNRAFNSKGQPGGELYLTGGRRLGRQPVRRAAGRVSLRCLRIGAGTEHVVHL